MSGCSSFRQCFALAVAACFLILASGLTGSTATLGHWQFDENGGNVAADSSGNAWNGTLTDFADTSAGAGEYEGGSGWTSDGALNFDGVSLENAGIDTVRTELPIAAMSGQSFTVEAVLAHNWLAQGWSPFFGQSDSECCPHIFFFGKRSGEDKLHHNISGLGGGDSDVVPVSDGNPHHLALVFDDNADTIDLYFDHVNVGHRDDVTGTLDTFEPNTLWLGGLGHNGAERWNGYAWEARVSVDDTPGDGAGALGPGSFLPLPTPNPAPGPLGPSFSFADFSDTSMFRARGSAGPLDDRLRLTSRTGGGQAGSSFLNGTVQFVKDLSFSTQFTWEVSESNTGFTDEQDGGEFDPVRAGADGFTLVIQDAGPAALGNAGGALGMDPLGGNYVAVEFDTWPSGVHDADPATNGNHIAIDLSGDPPPPSIAETPDDPEPGAIPRFNDGGLRYTWVEYDGETQLMEVYYSETPVKPESPTLTATVDLAAHFGDNTNLYVGFTGGTGGALNNQDIVQWDFASVPEPSSVALALLGLIGLAAFAARRR